MRANAAEVTEMMMMMMSSSLSPDLIILSVTSNLQELFPTSLLTIQAYSPNKANKSTIGPYSYSNHTKQGLLT